MLLLKGLVNNISVHTFVSWDKERPFLQAALLLWGKIRFLQSSFCLLRKQGSPLSYYKSILQWKGYLNLLFTVTGTCGVCPYHNFWQMTQSYIACSSASASFFKNLIAALCRPKRPTILKTFTFFSFESCALPSSALGHTFFLKDEFCLQHFYLSSKAFSLSWHTIKKLQAWG